MRLLITGSRSWPEDQAWIVSKTLDGFLGADPMVTSTPDVLIDGASSGGGVDLWAEEWYIKTDKFVEIELYPVMPLEYEMYGKSAPRWRNERMVNMSLPDFVLAFFWEHETPGTLHCYNYAKSKGIPGLVIVGGV